MRFAGIVEPGVSTGVVTSSQYIKGGYAVFQTQEELDEYILAYGSMDNSVIVKGMPLYVVETGKLFRVTTDPAQGVPCEIDEDETTKKIEQDITQILNALNNELKPAVETLQTEVTQVQTRVEGVETRVETLEQHALRDNDILVIYGGSAKDLIDN